MNHGSDNMGSTPVQDREHRRELEEQFGVRYQRVATEVHGSANRRERRRARFKKPDRG